MMTVPIPMDGTEGGRSHLGALQDALVGERRLLEELMRVLAVQREGISSDDLEALDESVFAAHRVFRTLGEARQRRRTLLSLVGVDEGLQLRDLEAAVGSAGTPDLLASRDALLAAAERLARELEVNRRVIDGAMAVGEKLLGAFIGGEQTTTLYGQGTGPQQHGGAGAIVNTRV